MTARPWMKFYPPDWRADPALRSCSIGARGLWLEMLCIMHEAQPRGSLLVNGSPVSIQKLVNLAGVSLKEGRAFYAELETAGVFSIQGGIVFSRRMRRDEEKAERDKENGKGGGNPRLKPQDNVGVNPHVNGEDKAQIPEPRDHSSEPNGSGADAPPDPKTELFRRGREILGNTSGGLIAKLLKSFGKEDDPKAIAKARARLEDASTKANPAEWIGRVLAPKPGEFKLMSNIEGVI